MESRIAVISIIVENYMAFISSAEWGFLTGREG